MKRRFEQQDKSDHESADDDDQQPLYVPLKQRREEQFKKIKQIQQQQDNQDNDCCSDLDQAVEDPIASQNDTQSSLSTIKQLNKSHDHKQQTKSLLDISLELSAAAAKAQGLDASSGVLIPLKSQAQKQIEEEQALLKNVLADRLPLKGANQHSKNVTYTKSLSFGWGPKPNSSTGNTTFDPQSVRTKYNIITSGRELPDPVLEFTDLNLPSQLYDYMNSKKILKPSPIQMQGLPVVLSGRDMIGVAFTGSGKTLVFALGMIMWSLQYELRLPLIKQEGPVGMIISPSRELAKQTHDIVNELCDFLTRPSSTNSHYPKLNTLLTIGGISMSEQLKHIQQLPNGLHMVIGTPGRLLDMLDKRKFNCDNCKYLALDESDTLIMSEHFESDIRRIFDHFGVVNQFQRVLMTATMPKKVQEFAISSLYNPVVINVGRAGAANQDIIHEVEYVKQEAKIFYLLECLNKTAPQTLIFSSSQVDVDLIEEFLLTKHVSCVSVHGGKTQHERLQSIDTFKQNKADVLVCTDVGSKGLDFQNIQHVINYDCPPEIETWVHRSGRTGRCFSEFTQVLLSDGMTSKIAKDLIVSDVLLTWDFRLGQPKPISIASVGRLQEDPGPMYNINGNLFTHDHRIVLVNCYKSEFRLFTTSLTPPSPVSYFICVHWFNHRAQLDEIHHEIEADLYDILSTEQHLQTCTCKHYEHYVVTPREESQTSSAAVVNDQVDISSSSNPNSTTSAEKISNLIRSMLEHKHAICSKIERKYSNPYHALEWHHMSASDIQIKEFRSAEFSQIHVNLREHFKLFCPSLTTRPGTSSARATITVDQCIPFTISEAIPKSVACTSLQVLPSNSDEPFWFFLGDGTLTHNSGQTGIATTFINKDVRETTLLDLKHILQEANQAIPPILQAMNDSFSNTNPHILHSTNTKSSGGCEYCGGLGHSILECPKLAQKNKSKQNNSFGYDLIENEQ